MCNVAFLDIFTVSHQSATLSAQLHNSYLPELRIYIMLAKHIFLMNSMPEWFVNLHAYYILKDCNTYYVLKSFMSYYDMRKSSPPHSAKPWDWILCLRTQPAISLSSKHL